MTSKLEIPAEDLKPADVDIIYINTVTQQVPDALGTGIQLSLLILGLGNDNRIYKYDGIAKLWSLQA